MRYKKGKPGQPFGKYSKLAPRWHEMMSAGIYASTIAKIHKITRNQVIGAVWRYKTGRRG